jgi:hypothetical protein
MGQTNSYNNFAAHDVTFNSPPASCVKGPNDPGEEGKSYKRD